MDITETYIKMADCPQIQLEKKSVERGDYWCWKSYPEKVYFRAERMPLEMVDSRNKRERNNKIWLPRQDDLQGMVKLEGYGPIHLIQRLNEFWQSLGYWLDKCDWSMEQLWLAFVMKEKHNKVWDGQKWQHE